MADVAIEPLALTTAWVLRGNAHDAAFIQCATQLLQAAPPAAPMTSAGGARGTLLATAPRAWLYLASSRRDDFDAARRAFAASGGALFDVSASHVGWRVSGDAAPRVLNRGCPLDLDWTVFAPGRCAQSVFGQLGVLVWRPDEARRFVVLFARSYADDARRDLEAAAAP